MVSPRDEVEITFARSYRSSVGTWSEGDTVTLPIETACLINRDSPGTFDEGVSGKLDQLNDYFSAEVAGSYPFLHESTAQPIGDLSGYLYPSVVNEAQAPTPHDPTAEPLDLDESVKTIQRVAQKLEEDLGLNTPGNPEPQKSDNDTEDSTDNSEDDSEEKQDTSKEESKDDSTKKRDLKAPGSTRQVTKSTTR